jgi:hypothetical protein
MSGFVSGQRITILDENMVFPRCHVCDSEMTPMIPDEDMIDFIEENGWPDYAIFRTPKKELIVFTCFKCLPPEEEE